MDQSRICDRLRTEILTDLQLERVHTAFRRAFLAGAATEDIPFMVSLACQCFNNEYIYPVSLEEQLALSRVKQRIDSIRDLIVYAMYEPLWTVRDAAVRFCLDRDPEANVLFTRQISEPVEEEEIKKSIPSFGVSADPTSQAVREQYEQFPYPRWVDVELPKPRTFQEGILERFPFLKPVHVGSPVRILIAGCGTGRHPIMVAAKYPDAHVTAIDLSKASLAYGIRQARRYKLSNLNFLHGDILNLRMPQEFDAIEAVGSLDCMLDLVAGLRALMNVLKPGGLMKLGLCSRRTRAQFQEATRVVRERNIGRSPGELRDIRQEIIRLQNGATNGPTHFEDFYYMSGFRDLLCPAHEVTFNPAELKPILQAVGLRPLGYRNLKPADRAEYVQRFPQDPYMGDLDLLDAFESDHPDVFRGELQMLWAQSK